MQRFYVAGPLIAGTEIAFDQARAQQIARVLRLHAGGRVAVFDGAGALAEVELTLVEPRRVCGRVGPVQRVAWPFALRPVLCLALIRPQRFEWALEKAVELGAWRVQPLLTARTQHGDAATGASRQARWQAIMAEAAEQCGSAYLPELRPPLDLAAALALPSALRLLPHTDAALPRQSVAGALAGACPPAGAEVALYIGPEGGFTPEEATAALAAGCRPISLGPLTLRSETAALAALAAVNVANS